MAGAALETGLAHLTWDPRDPLFEFNDENCSITQTPVAASMLVSMPAEENMPELERPDLEQPPTGEPQDGNLPADDPKPM